MLEQFNEVGDRWVRKLMTMADGKTQINMSDSLCRITLDCIGKVMYWPYGIYGGFSNFHYGGPL